MAPFLNNVATNNQWVWSDFVMGIQAGIEIADSKRAGRRLPYQLGAASGQVPFRHYCCFGRF